MPLPCHVYRGLRCTTRPYLRAAVRGQIAGKATLLAVSAQASLHYNPSSVRQASNRSFDSRRRHRIDTPKFEGRHHARRDSNNKDGRTAVFRVDFAGVLATHLELLKDELLDSALLRRLAHEREQASGESDYKTKIWEKFRRETATPRNRKAAGTDSIYARLEHVHRNPSRKDNLAARIRDEFNTFALKDVITPDQLQLQKAAAQLRFPAEWYPSTRRMKRTVHLHVGPTNSGKTFRALQRLEQAKSGLYAGPLRLLAQEVYARLNSKGIPCALVTGDERRRALTEDGTEMTDINDMESHRSCTVEMAPINMDLDVAVIDEIQLISDEERGWAWTQALLGIRAKEIHLCGEARSVEVIKGICALVGEEVIVHNYERLTPLRMATTSLKGDLRRLRKGDAVIAFSVVAIHAMRREIEQVTGKKVAIVYGSLPSETRAQQARLFNDPDNDYDILVASDAIGMGLNLAVKRIIFETSQKYNGVKHGPLTVSAIKQIGGRAGRFRVAGDNSPIVASAEIIAAARANARSANANASNAGLVTTLESQDFPSIAAAMKSEPEPLPPAIIQPPVSVFERFASYFPVETPFSLLLQLLADYAQTGAQFRFADMRDAVTIARMIDDVPGLSITDRYVICAAPLGRTSPWVSRLINALVRCIANQESGNILDIPEFELEILDQTGLEARLHLGDLERLHSAVILYLWLSYRFAGVFTTRPLAFQIRRIVEARIESTLDELSQTDTARRHRHALFRKNFPQPSSEQSDEGIEAMNPVLLTDQALSHLHDGSKSGTAPSFSEGSGVTREGDMPYMDQLDHELLPNQNPTAPIGHVAGDEYPRSDAQSADRRSASNSP